MLSNFFVSSMSSPLQIALFLAQDLGTMAPPRDIWRLQLSPGGDGYSELMVQLLEILILSDSGTTLRAQIAPSTLRDTHPV